MSAFASDRRVVVSAIVLAAFAGSARACSYHFLTGLPEPVGDWSNLGVTAKSATGQVMAADAAESAAITRLVSGAVASAAPTTDVTVTNWLVNTTGLKGRSTDTGINAIVSQFNANVQQVAYTATSTYVKVTSIPDYNMGPFGGIPNSPANANATFRITRTPLVNAGTKTATGGGAIGVLLNGVEVFNASDQQSFNNNGYWHGNAGVAEGPSLDASYSHPQQQGTYHSHASPIGLLNELGASSAKMTLIGFAIDGFPIYGNYGPKNADGTGGLVPMTSSYQLRTGLTDRTSFADGSAAQGVKRGPMIDSNHPLGYYQEDYQYVAASGTLDQYNGRTVVTPEYPLGTYAYFASVNATTLAPTYPYYVGPSYYGVVQTDNLPGSTIVVPSDAVTYVPEPAAMALVGLGALTLRRRRV